MDFKMLIDGQLVAGEGTVEVINPASGDVFTEVPRASEAQLNAAVAAAKSAQKDWAATPVSSRRAKVEALAAEIAAHAEELARLITLEQGKPLAEAAGEVEWAQGYLAHTAALELPDRVIQNDAAARIETRHRPLGVVAGIVAWNFPLLLCCWKIGPALMAGNAIVLKPAPTTPVTALKLGELCARIFPPGLVNIVSGGDELGPLLTAHPDVAKIGFTGSSETGKRIMAGAAMGMKRLTLEMGGNDPAIVLPDADVKAVAQRVFEAAFLNAGQVCLAVKRVYVPDSLYDAFCAELAGLAEKAVVGDGLQQGVTIGPVQNKTQFAKLAALLEETAASGTLLTGGVIEGRAGYFISPAIVRDVGDGDRIVDEEQFGPVLPVVRYHDIQEVIARANASPFGLGGSVHTSDTAKGAEIAGRIESGTVWVNQHINIGPHIPMAGFKASGFGVEQSVEGLTEYTQLQVLNVARG
ncbi:aldehyde dehydrogenase family protein [Cribrihabitans pelagius]|uniref:aldehyde dehydrogenase family protein n=1 Tax=Cribrihabitans pelagius TaxID=1765746 RepID=UPI003B5B4623